MCIFTRIYPVLFLLFQSYAGVYFLSDSLFPIDINLQPNVIFWTKIYSEISIREGLIHDSEYPNIVYQRIKVGNRWGKQLDKFVNIHKEKITTSLVKIQTLDKSAWSAEEHRIAALFEGITKEVLTDARKRLRFQLGQKENFWEGLKRSGAIIDSIKTLLKTHQLPPQIAYLPLVESSFNSQAYSKAGAAGIWQLMPTSAAKHLVINNFIDERKDPLLSTVAAIEILKHNYSVLKSWPLAITAYNRGLTGVLRAVKESGSANLGDIVCNYRGEGFRFASKNFYSCFIATLIVAQNYQQYFGPLSQESPWAVQDIVLNQPLRIGDIYQILGLTEQQFRELNPKFLSTAYTSNQHLNPGVSFRISAHISPQQLALKVEFFQNTQNLVLTGSFIEPSKVHGEFNK